VKGAFADDSPQKAAAIVEPAPGVTAQPYARVISSVGLTGVPIQKIEGSSIAPLEFISEAVTQADPGFRCHQILDEVVLCLGVQGRQLHLPGAARLGSLPPAVVVTAVAPEAGIRAELDGVRLTLLLYRTATAGASQGERSE